LEDNPYLDKESYTASLNKLDPVTREQLRHGDWDISIAGGMFDRTWFKIVDKSSSGDQVRFWDLAATEPAKGKDPDWTVGVLMVKSPAGYCVKDVVRVQKTPGDVEELILHTARLMWKNLFFTQHGLMASRRRSTWSRSQVRRERVSYIPMPNFSPDMRSMEFLRQARRL
jgi:hypothetical protein